MREAGSLLGLFLLAACSGQRDGNAQTGNPFGNAAAGGERGQQVTFSGLGRNQLCLKGARAGFIVYAPRGDANCSVRGKVERDGNRLLIRPDGDVDCRIDAREEASSLVLGPVAPACDYYCGPGASFAGRAFTSGTSATPAVDFAGDPLC